ncbi:MULTISPECIES: preprotein translocase subunit YajC [unclassified Paenibacillus]|uniref:preprotein translocase subunit YajC n=1 Tax=unclassified Paenibacillus TaxID=185978 RepID=UPI001052CAFC|nr:MULTISPECIES: preprotein translocase subunit YajC [unclassified Paenibacillus]NIK69818.1 preprotein translocase subunit YajC [Paenibacillus sp. BK720]TCM97654.1 preprotein translocase subunit YajC [Paenibacillus sp. BK033]
MNAYLAADSAGSTNIFQMIWPFILMFAVFYFLLIRPQQKKTKQRNSLLSQLKKGDKIQTIGGLQGTIVELTDDTVVLRVNDTTKMTFDRSAISSVLNSAPAATE